MRAGGGGADLVRTRYAPDTDPLSAVLINSFLKPKEII